MLFNLRYSKLDLPDALSFGRCPTFKIKFYSGFPTTESPCSALLNPIFPPFDVSPGHSLAAINRFVLRSATGHESRPHENDEIYRQNEENGEDGGDGEELFSQARETEGDPDPTSEDDGPNKTEYTSRTDTSGTATEQDLASIADITRGAERSPARSEGQEGDDGQAEEWCSGHVCLRLRPDGLREASRGGRELGDGNSEDGESRDDAEARSDGARGRQVCSRVVGVPCEP